MAMNKKKILLTRTVPIEIFHEILHGISKKYSNEEIIILIQESMKKKLYVGKKHQLIGMNQGLFSMRLISNDWLERIVQLDIDIMIIPSNNKNFLGYGEFIKLGKAIRAKKILLIDKEMNIKKIDIWRKIFGNYILPFFGGIFTIFDYLTRFIVYTVFLISFPLFWIKIKINKLKTRIEIK